MKRCTFLVCLHRLRYSVLVPWKRKKTAWSTWRRFLVATETFIRLLCVSKPSDFALKIVENFVVLMYHASCPHARVNE